MSDSSKTEQPVDAEIEIPLNRADLLILSEGGQLDEQMAVEADDGTVMNLTITLIGESAKSAPHD